MASARAIINGSSILLKKLIRLHPSTHQVRAFAFDIPRALSTTPAGSLPDWLDCKDGVYYTTLDKLHKACFERTFSLKEKYEETAWLVPPDEPLQKELFEVIYRNPFVVEGPKCHFDIVEAEDAVYARFDIPGVNVKNVRVWIEKMEDHFVLNIAGEDEEKDPNDLFGGKFKEPRRIYSEGYAFPDTGVYQTDKVVACVKNGVIRIVVPKVIGRQQKDVSGQDGLS